MANVTQNGQSVVVTYPVATATDNSAGGQVQLTYSHASGSVFSFGETTVTVLARDPSGNQAMCTFVVIVQGMANGILRTLITRYQCMTFAYCMTGLVK